MLSRYYQQLVDLTTQSKDKHAKVKGNALDTEMLLLSCSYFWRGRGPVCTQCPVEFCQTLKGEQKRQSSSCDTGILSVNTTDTNGCSIKLMEKEDGWSVNAYMYINSWIVIPCIMAQLVCKNIDIPYGYSRLFRITHTHTHTNKVLFCLNILNHLHIAELGNKRRKKTRGKKKVTSYVLTIAMAA